MPPKPSLHCILKQPAVPSTKKHDIWIVMAEADSCPLSYFSFQDSYLLSHEQNNGALSLILTVLLLRS